MDTARLVHVLSATLLVGTFLSGCGDADPRRGYPDEPPVFVGAEGGSFGAAGGVFAGVYSEPLVVANEPPPPVSGGTLLALPQSQTAVVADPDHDQIVIVDTDQRAVRATIPLRAGDEPWRLVADRAGLVHVALRSGGEIATIDPGSGTLVRRDAVCPYPRGIDYDPTADTVVIACAGGELVTLPAAGGAPTRSIQLVDSSGQVVRDLRDVIIQEGHLLVTRFRAAEVLVIDPDGSISATLRPKSQTPSFQPAVAWRTQAAPGGGVIMVHQEEQTSEVEIKAPGGYGGFFCGSIVRTEVSLIKLDGSTFPTPLTSVLPVDFTITDGSDGKFVHVASAATRSNGSPLNPAQIAVVSMRLPVTESPAAPIPDGGFGACVSGGAVDANLVQGQVVAVAPGAEGRVIYQTRAPSTLVVGDQAVPLPGASRADTGHDIFHFGTMGGIACASCHPEGRDDGHVWSFTGLGPRRTQSLGGGISGTEPFHWGGDMKDFSTLAHDVFNSRMTGPSLDGKYVDALKNWIDRIPLPKSTAPRDAVAVERGRGVFNSPAAACSTCHSGAKLTNNTSVDVGTGGLFQVPSLRGLIWRAPFMHDGCAPTIADRFGACGGTKHGQVSMLNSGQKADLIAYLETL